MERLDLDEVVARAAGDYNNGDDEANGDIDDDAAVAEDENGDGNSGSGASDGDEDQKDNSMSVVQALAQGVDVAPSEDGKVSLHCVFKCQENVTVQLYQK